MIVLLWQIAKYRFIDVRLIVRFKLGHYRLVQLHMSKEMCSRVKLIPTTQHDSNPVNH